MTLDSVIADVRLFAAYGQALLFVLALFVAYRLWRLQTNGLTKLMMHFAIAAGHYVVWSVWVNVVSSYIGMAEGYYLLIISAWRVVTVYHFVGVVAVAIVCFLMDLEKQVDERKLRTVDDKKGVKPPAQQYAERRPGNRS